MFHMCFRRRQQLQWRLNGKKLVLLIFSRKSEVSVVSVLTGSKEVKMKVACFRDTYDYGRLHRADYDVITWWTCKWSVNIFQMAACGPLGKNRLGTFGTPTSHPGRPILIYKAAELTAKAFARSFTIEKSFSSFRATSLLNPDMITHDMFFHSVATEILQQPEKVTLW